MKFPGRQQNPGSKVPAPWLLTLILIFSEIDFEFFLVKISEKTASKLQPFLLIPLYKGGQDILFSSDGSFTNISDRQGWEAS